MPERARGPHEDSQKIHHMSASWPVQETRERSMVTALERYRFYDLVLPIMVDDLLITGHVTVTNADLAVRVWAKVKRHHPGGEVKLIRVPVGYRIEVA
jgi:hypothetical protein